MSKYVCTIYYGNVLEKCSIKIIGHYFTTPPLFDLKLVYSYLIEVADSESDLGLHGKPLVSEIFTFYHLLEYARSRPGRRGHVHLGHNFSVQIFFQNVLTFFRFIRFMRVLRVYVGYLLLRVYVRYLLLTVYVGIYFEGVCRVFRVFTLRVYVGYLLLRVYIGYLLISVFLRNRGC